ncbi:MAG TPA: hypothetical protein VKT25_08945 [Ktedonobacteraceae bacterium]|nr:hypothetical protein [Ktedonobacteraceae bacterium]
MAGQSEQGRPQNRIQPARARFVAKASSAARTSKGDGSQPSRSLASPSP